MKTITVVLMIINLLYASNAKANEKLIKKYYEDNKTLKSTTKFIDNKKIITKLFYKNGVTKAEIIFSNKVQKGNIFKIYDINGTLTEKSIVRTDTNPNTIHFIKYKNGIKSEESHEIKIGNIWKKDGINTYYNDKGLQVRQEYYKKGILIHTAYCSFDVTRYVKLLETKHIKKIADYEGGKNIFCKKLEDDSYNILIEPFYDNKYQISLLIGAIDTKTNKLKFSIFDTNTRLGEETFITIQDITYQSITNPKVFDVVNTTHMHQLTDLSYSTYKVAINEIVPLKKPTFKIENIVEDVKNGKTLSYQLLKSILFEEKINEQNIDMYIRLFNYMKSNCSYKKTAFLGHNILDRFPNIKSVNFTPKFTDFIVKIFYKNPNKPLIQKGFGRLYRTRLKKAIKEKKPEFAGKYIITQWGCDDGKNECTTGGIIDASTGLATEFPFKYYAHNETKEIIYKPNSSLIIFKGDFVFKNGSKLYNQALFYEFKDSDFLLLKEENINEK